MQKVPDEREDIVMTTNAIRAFTGRRPRGWLGPGLTETWETPDILAEQGYDWHQLHRVSPSLANIA